MSKINETQKNIDMGNHGEDYGNWMSNAVLYFMLGIIAVLAVVSVTFFTVLDIIGLGILFAIFCLGVVCFILYAYWVRRRYSYDGGRKMDEVHQVILTNLDFDGQGSLLDVGCGSGALGIRAALTWPDAKILGVDNWGVMYSYSKKVCEENIQKAGVTDRCSVQNGDAQKLDFANETFDAVVSNYVYHNLGGRRGQELVLETLRVLKKGGVFAINDSMRPKMYGDVEEFAQKLRDMGYSDVCLVDTGTLFLARRRWLKRCS